MRGKATVRAKNVQWLADNDEYEAAVSGPFVSPERFALVIGFDWTRRETGERVRMQEVAVYTVENGQVTRGEFLYGAMGLKAGRVSRLWRPVGGHRIA